MGLEDADQQCAGCSMYHMGCTANGPSRLAKMRLREAAPIAEFVAMWPPCQGYAFPNAVLAHTALQNGELICTGQSHHYDHKCQLRHAATSVRACHSYGCTQSQAQPTWTVRRSGIRLCGEQNHKHHHHHRYCPAACCNCSGASPSPAAAARASSSSSSSSAAAAAVLTCNHHSHFDLLHQPPTKLIRASSALPPKTKTSLHSKLLCPPFPSPSSPPYILCQHCSHLLSLPLLHSPSNSSFLKLRCALCFRTSIFSTCHVHRPSSRSPTPSDCIVMLSVEHPDTPFITAPSENIHASAHAAAQPAGEADHHITLNADVSTNETATNVLPALCKYSKSLTHSPPSKLDPEFAGFTSVQDWVNSLEQEMQCPTPLMGTGFNGSDDWQHKSSQHFAPAVPGSPLHEHFGYKSPTELFEKAIFSDDEIKAQSDTMSSASTSTTSGFARKSMHRDDCNADERAFHDGNMCCDRDKLADSTKCKTRADEDYQSSLANLLRRGLRGLSKRRSHSIAVVVNGYSLSQQAIKRAEAQAGRLCPGAYWYDSKAGFWGVIGGPCLGIVPPFIEELNYPMVGDCSNGDTQVFVNGRELHQKDLLMLAQRGLSKKPGKSYRIGFDGVVFEETSGQELKHLGKLAPTVERRGKGFGMYSAKLQN